VVTDPRGNKTTYCMRTDDYTARKVIDARGNKQDISYNAFGNVNLYTAPSGAVYDPAYDASDRLTSLKGPGQETWTLTYGDTSFRPDTISDPQGHTLRFTYTSDGNLEQICAASWANGCTFADPKTGFVTLDWRDNPPDPDQKGTLLSATDGNGNKTTYSVDGEGNYTRASYPKSDSGQTLIGDTQYGYDALSRVTSVTYPRPGSTTVGDTIARQIHYDPLDRTTQIDYPGGLQNSLCYTYDPNGNLTQRLDDCSDAGRSDTKDTYDYEARNLRVDDKLRRGREVRYGYDRAGNRTSVDFVSPNVGETTYAYNAVNLVTTITQPDAAQFTYSNYNKDNQPTTIAFPNGLTQTNTYTHHRLTEALVSGPSGQVSDLKYRYDLDRAGAQDDMTALLTQVTSQVQGSTTTTNYDYASSLNRLTKATIVGGDTYQYTYDLAGNITQKTVSGATTNYSYNNANQLTQAGTASRTYDLDGNLLSVFLGKSYRYDDRGHTVGVTPFGSSEIPFAYADAGQTERLSAGSTQFTDSVLGLSLQAPGGPVTEFVRNPDTGEALGMHSADGTDYYYISDQIGTVEALTNAQGGVVDTYRYEPYGKALGSSSGPSNPIRFQNQFLDAQTGLYKMGLRYYDPPVARWTQRDPLNVFQDPRQANRYAYAGDDPVNNADPSGAQLPSISFPNVGDVVTAGGQPIMPPPPPAEQPSLIGIGVGCGVGARTGALLALVFPVTEPEAISLGCIGGSASAAYLGYNIFSIP
jgi:RHS repeat-associated protein